MDSRKNGGMAKIFPCLRPSVVDDDGCVKPNGGKAVVGKGNIMHSGESSLSSSSDADSSLDGARSKGSSRRRFSRALKAVLFDTSLTKKIRERKSRKNSFRSGSSLSLKSEKIANQMNDKSSSVEESSDADEMNTINSSRSSLLFSSSTNASSSLSSSCSSSRNANSRSLSERRGSSGVDSMDRRGSFRTTNSEEKIASFRAPNPVERKESFRGTKSMELQKQNSAAEKIDQYYSSTIGLCLLLISLLVLVFWGKICAIFCTSIWLFFGPRRIKPVILAGSVNMDSEEYKKRVIMEGLLERNRSRAAQ